MVGKDKARFSVTIPTSDDERLREIARTHRPKVSKNYLMALAVTRLLDALDGRQLPRDIGRSK